MNVKQIVKEMLCPFEAEGFEIWDVEFAKEGKDRQLRVFVDKDGGISLDDCERVSRFLSEKLDEEDPISEEYSLVVSSPGMDRPLLKERHFVRYAGAPVEVSLYEKFDGLKKFSATLGRKEPDFLFVTPIDNMTLEPIGDEIAIPAPLVSKVRLKLVI